MSQITIYLDNSLNSADNNPPGFSQWVGGNEHGDPLGIKVDKTDTNLAYTITNDISFLQTWYYEYGWISGANINGPFTDQQVIKLIPIKK
jgi:hypothetical protein